MVSCGEPGGAGEHGQVKGWNPMTELSKMIGIGRLNLAAEWDKVRAK